MCGIAGVVTPGEVPDRAVVDRMSATLRHRGPDDEGLYIGPDACLGFRRLSIIDLATGNQPATNATGTVQVVFNGEIYNYRELRADLERAGHRFKTQGDAEVLPHLYEERGAQLVDDLRGMFAFALWDTERRQLLLARDPLGEKPLYWARLPGGGLAFASEIKALLAGGVSREPDPQAIVEYLFHLYVPPPQSAFAAIKKLEPGRLLRFAGGEPQIERYWSPCFQVAPRTEEEHIEGLRDRIIDAVGTRLIADVPLGAFLSGGVDSASVVAAMRQVHDGPLHTFTIVFEGFPEDESEKARAASRHLGTEHHELKAHLDGPGLLPTIVGGFDEPFGNATAVLIWSLAELTRNYVKVCLTGDGADELFLGYERFRGLQAADAYRRLTPETARRAAGVAASRLSDGAVRGPALRRMREFLETGAMTPHEAYRSWVGYFTRAELSHLLMPELRDLAMGADRFLAGLTETSSNGFRDLNDVSRVEIESFLPNNILEYADRMSMAHGLELRAPFVDHLLVEYVATLPADLKLRRGRTKWALRKALERDLPPTSLRGRKRGLNPPLSRWLAEGAAPLIAELLSPAAVRRRGFVRPEAVKQLLAEHDQGRRDRSLHIWALLLLELWFQLRVD